MIKINLKELMKKRGKTLSELSSLTGLSINTLSMLSTGKSKGIQFSTLDSLIQALDCSVNELILHSNNYFRLEILDIKKNSNNIFVLKYKSDENSEVQEQYIKHQDNSFIIDWNVEIGISEEYEHHLFVILSLMILKKLHENNLYFDLRNSPILFEWHSRNFYKVGLPDFHFDSLEDVIKSINKYTRLTFGKIEYTNNVLIFNK